MESLYLVGIAVLALFAFVLAVVLFNFFGLWLRARIANAPVSLGKMVGMRLRKVPVGLIVDNRITAVKAGLDVRSDPLEAHYLAGGDVSHVVLALIAADKAGITLDFNRACAIDLATKGTGKTVLEAVRTSINPKVIDAPSPNMGRTTIDGVAQDGIGVKVKARVTVRSHLDRFVGGATEETIIARVGEGIVSAIGSAHSYKEVLENPDRISKTVLAKGLDSNTAFEILSIDIADVDGKNFKRRIAVQTFGQNCLGNAVGILQHFLVGMRRANRANNALANPRDDCFFSRAANESIEMRAHRHTRFDFHADSVLCDAIDGRAAHGRVRRINHLRIDARAHRFQNRLASSLGGKVDGTGSVEIERDSCLISSNQSKDHVANVTAGEVMRFQRIAANIQTCFDRGDAVIHDQTDRHFS